MGKIITSFDPAEDLIYVDAWLWGPTSNRHARLIVDTGASESFVTPELIEAIGYSARDAIHVTSVTSIIGQEFGYRVQVQKFAALGFELRDYPLNVRDLSEDCGFSGLLGLSFLRHLNVELRVKEGVLLAELA